MKDYLADIVRAAPTPVQGRNVAREYLQARILGALQLAGAMVPLAFYAATESLFRQVFVAAVHPGEPYRI